ncbi:MAG: hypothetical protein KIS66_13860 [Fimbriimonadaceae bacterium]|nr:hypothetical protein [Fimbriimonadaceae bacterium]
MRYSRRRRRAGYASTSESKALPGDPDAPVTRAELVDVVRDAVLVAHDDEDVFLEGGDHIAENWTTEHTTQWIEAVDKTDQRSHREKMWTTWAWMVAILAAFGLIAYLVGSGHDEVVVQVAPHIVSLVAGFAGGYGFARTRKAREED